MRKMIDRDRLVHSVNLALSADPPLNLDGLSLDQAYRLGMANTLEHILTTTGTYAGWNYQASQFLPADQQTDNNVLIPDADETRRRYF